MPFQVCTCKIVLSQMIKFTMMPTCSLASYYHRSLKFYLLYFLVLMLVLLATAVAERTVFAFCFFILNKRQTKLSVNLGKTLHITANSQS